MALRTRVLICGVLAVFVLSGCPDDDDNVADTGPGKPLDTRVRVQAPMGKMCTDPGYDCRERAADKSKLKCIALESATGYGYCSKVCTEAGTECYGVPNGQFADCIITSGPSDVDAGNQTKYCGFICKSKAGVFDCPPDMVCGKVNQQGVALCLPNPHTQMDGGVKDKAVRLDKKLDTGPAKDSGLAPNSGALCTGPGTCKNPKDVCLTWPGATKGMCLMNCTPGTACPKPPGANYASECQFRYSGSGGTTHYACGWYCLYQGKTYKCPNETDYECKALSASEPNIKFCLAK